MLKYRDISKCKKCTILGNQVIRNKHINISRYTTLGQIKIARKTRYNKNKNKNKNERRHGIILPVTSR